MHQLAADRIDTDVCVIGAGPAGITFAREWLGAATRVDVLESGGFGSAQDLGGAETISAYHRPDAIAAGRTRQFGGTSNQWLYHAAPVDGRSYARSLPPEAIDFEQHNRARDGRGEKAGWPMSVASLGPWYERAQAAWNRAPFDYRPQAWGAEMMPAIDFPTGTIRTGIVQHGPNDVFTTRYRDDLLAADNIRIHPEHTVVALEGDATGDTIRRARVVRADGSCVNVVARAYVLAAGGIENPHLLLLSDPTRPGGPGNPHDLIGRYLSDHPEFRMGTIEPRNRDIFDDLGMYDLRWVGQYLIAGMLTLTESVKLNEGLLNTSIALVPQAAGFGSPTHRSIATLLAITRGERPGGLAEHIRTLLASPRTWTTAFGMRRRAFHEFAGGWSLPGPHRAQFKVIEAFAATEQSPNPENRITVDVAQRDGLGRPRPRLTWEWSSADRTNLERSIALYAEAFEAAGLGRFRRWVEMEGPGRPFFGGIHHPMSGTRMNEDPKHGIVDRDCKVHGLSNLYVSGSSVFPTGHGYANPTLTVLALAIRLADHMKQRLGSGGQAAP